MAVLNTANPIQQSNNVILLSASTRPQKYRCCEQHSIWINCIVIVMSIIFGLLGLGFVDGMEYGFFGINEIISGDIVYQPAHSEDYLNIGDEERQKLNDQFERNRGCLDFNVP